MFGLSVAQYTAALERLAYIVVPMMTAHGFTSKDDEQMIVAAIMALVGAGIGVWNNRAKRLADRAAKANPEAVTIGPDDLATGTRSANIVSNRDFEIKLK